MKAKNSLVWIESTGGPLLLLEEELLAHWHGCFSNSRDPVTDYDRACNVADYLGLVEVNHGHGLVLGEEPFRTAWWPSVKPGDGLFVRWVCADNETAVIDAIDTLSSAVWQETGVEFQVSSGRLRLFDSACRGGDIGEWLAIEMPSGRYHAETFHHEPDANTSLVLHRFVAMPGA